MGLGWRKDPKDEACINDERKEGKGNERETWMEVGLMQVRKEQRKEEKDEEELQGEATDEEEKEKGEG